MHIPKNTKYGSLLALLIISGLGGADNELLADTAVAVNSGAAIWALALQPDRKIIVGGYNLTSLAGQSCENLGRLNSDGSFDVTFHPKGAHDVTALAVQPDGKILVGGYVTNLSGQVCTNLARLNPDGSADNSFRSPNPNSVVWAFCIQPDGKILIAGGFTTLGASTNQFIARLNMDGSLDTSFHAVVDGPPFAVSLQPDGKVLLGGGFSSLNGENRKWLARVQSNGAVDTSFAANLPRTPLSMALDGSGRLLVSFDAPEPLSKTFSVRLDSTGALDTSFSDGLHAPVNSFGLQADGAILALHGNGLARLRIDGSIDPSFAAITNGWGSCLALQADGGLVFNLADTIQLRNSNGAALPALHYQNGTLTWSLLATSSDVATASFGYTTNGVDWVSLGSGTRTSDGWQLSGVAAPPSSTLRVRGGVSGGYFNGSFWFEGSFFGPPVIPQQPVSFTNFVSAFNELAVYAGGSEPLAYQWFKEGAAIAGATNSVLNFAALSTADAGTYELAVSNQFGIVRSTQASVTALPLPRISFDTGITGLTNGQVAFNISGHPGATVVVEWSGNLVNWVPLKTNVLSEVPLVFNEVPPIKNRRFYRVRVPLY